MQQGFAKPRLVVKAPFIDGCDSMQVTSSNAKAMLQASDQSACVNTPLPSIRNNQGGVALGAQRFSAKSSKSQNA